MDIQKWGGAMDCNDVAQNRDKWRDLVNVVMKLGVSIKCGEILD